MPLWSGLQSFSGLGETTTQSSFLVVEDSHVSFIHR